MKQAIKELRGEIASLEKEQRVIKENRKTTNFVGERKYSPSEAQWRALETAERLRRKYAAYGLMKGKRFEEIENSAEPLHRGYSPENKCLSSYYIDSSLVGFHPLWYYLEDIKAILNKYGYDFQYGKEEEIRESSGGKIYKSNGDEKVVCLGE